MKKIFIVFVCLIMAGSAAADSVAEKVNYGRIIEELTAIKKYQDSILRIQDSIYRIQDSTYQQRMRAYEVRAEARANEKQETSPSEYAVLSEIKGNTDFKFFEDSWSLYGIAAILASIAAVIYAHKQYKSQKQTEENTKESEKHAKNAPVSVQVSTLHDLPRHFYRNIVCTCAIIFKHIHPENIDNGKRMKYPSESNLLKLQTLPDDIFLPIDIMDEKSYEEMHELRLLFRNYNTEVLVAAEHLSRQHLTDESLEQDFDNLLFKPFHLTKRTFKYEQMLSYDTADQNDRAIRNVIAEHFNKLNDANNLSVLLRPENNKFLGQLLDSGFGQIKDKIDKKDALIRSLKGFADRSIEKVSFADSLEEECMKGFIMSVSADKNNFKNWFDSNYKGKISDAKATLSADDLYESLKPYLEYLSRDSWNFGELFYYMLAVDIAIETDRIGMINY